MSHFKNLNAPPSPRTSVFPGPFWVLRKWGFIVPLFFPLLSSTLRRCVNSSQYGLCLHLPNFPCSVWGMRRALMGTMACVKREHGSEIGSKVSFPLPEALFHSPFQISYSAHGQAKARFGAPSLLFTLKQTWNRQKFSLGIWVSCKIYLDWTP